MEAYCVRCKAKKEVVNARSIVMKNGRPAVTGACITCGTKMFRIGKPA
jgi:RNase P subunit RPR2